jgi:microcystin synthetase protein McyA
MDGAKEYWLEVVGASAARLPVDLSECGNEVRYAETLSRSLDEEWTGLLLRETPRAYHTRVDEALLTALAESLREWSGERRLLLEVEGHGREDVLGEEADLSRTVGWFTSLYPVALELPDGGGIGEKLMSVKERLRGAPHRGMSYGLLRYLSGEEGLRERLGGGMKAEVVFNYLGQFADEGEEAPWELSWEYVGEEQSEEEERGHLLEVVCWVSGGRLTVNWTWCKGRHLRETIERVAEGFENALRELIKHCCSQRNSYFTPSDLGERESLNLKQNDIDEINRVVQDIMLGTPPIKHKAID